MTNQHYYCVIMAGGLGTRFWPVSRDSRPKQFLRLTKTGKSFLRLAYERIRDIIPAENTFVVSLQRYRDLVAAELPEMEPGNILLEPHNRNTASCIEFACNTILKRDPEAVVLVAPSDQVIGDGDLFRETVLQGLEYASAHDVLLTLGVLPRRPDPNFGYIQTDGPMEDGTPVGVKTFTEKPSKELAQVFIDSGEFLWNSGIFIWKASVIYEEIQKYAPEVAAQWNGWEQFLGTPAEKEYLERIYPDMPRTSIDYAVMEKSDRVMAIPAKFRWNDLGNWDSLYEYFTTGESGNAVKTEGVAKAEDIEETLVLSSVKGKLVAVKGLKDFVVIDSDDVLVICPKEEKSLKSFISELSLPEYKQFK